VQCTPCNSVATVLRILFKDDFLLKSYYAAKNLLRQYIVTSLEHSL
jgi:hypothetical protein